MDVLVIGAAQKSPALPTERTAMYTHHGHHVKIPMILSSLFHVVEVVQYVLHVTFETEVARDFWAPVTDLLLPSLGSGFLSRDIRLDSPPLFLRALQYIAAPSYPRFPAKCDIETNL